jgi:hydroxymethylpyrimidine pyrophosphatase-like HAD family hydrolase
MTTLFLFDVDGTIVNSGQAITTEMTTALTNLQQKQNVEIGIVGGGKLDKILEQMDNKQSSSNKLYEQQQQQTKNYWKNSLKK